MSLLLAALFSTDVSIVSKYKCGFDAFDTVRVTLAIFVAAAVAAGGGVVVVVWWR